MDEICNKIMMIMDDFGFDENKNIGNEVDSL